MLEASSAPWRRLGRVGAHESSLSLGGRSGRGAAYQAVQIQRKLVETWHLHGFGLGSLEDLGPLLLAGIFGATVALLPKGTGLMKMTIPVGISVGIS